ncbi:intradiol ring-cleavage dioxygenase [Alkalinema pantanalense CENA528]|uniref:intradiol ring-cleavage dioxygenase n=1 Tax=Alkalinema pantanalense TaxID=1620705 RepID=UPI003D6E94C1
MKPNHWIFKQRFSRRQALAIGRSVSTMFLVGCVANRAESRPSQSKAVPLASSNFTRGLPGCIARPTQTEGPYFVDEKLQRSDIRINTADQAVSAGIPLALQFRVSQISTDRCQPIVGAMVDIWHCDANGVYSDVQDRSFNTIGQNFLRGYQLTNDEGITQFVTIYPGWYSGRTVHIHFKIRLTNSSGQNYEFTSQLYFDDAVTDRVYAQLPYHSQGERTTRNANDGIYRNGGDQLLLSLNPVGPGYTAIFEIGLQLEG